MRLIVRTGRETNLQDYLRAWLKRAPKPKGSVRVAVDVDPAAAKTIELQPGEMSLHHVRLIHGSAPNPSPRRRIGFAIRYIPTRVRQIHGADSATLVRGVDEFKTFEHEPRPTRDFDPEFVAIHREIAERNAQILYKGTPVKSYDEPPSAGGM